MNRGDVVRPYSDGSGSKSRPAVVIQADFLNGLIDDTILVQITTTQHGIPDTEVIIDPAVETSSGLTHICVVSCVNVLTIDQVRIGRLIGYLSAATMRQVEDCLKKVLVLP
jgi:mRNA interferase MazF